MAIVGHGHARSDDLRQIRAPCAALVVEVPGMPAHLLSRQSQSCGRYRSLHSADHRRRHRSASCGRALRARRSHGTCKRYIRLPARLDTCSALDPLCKHRQARKQQWSPTEPSVFSWPFLCSAPPQGLDLIVWQSQPRSARCSSLSESLQCGAGSAAKSQCGRAWRHGVIRTTKRAASSNVASSTPGPRVGSIARVSASLKFAACAMRALWPARADDPKHQPTFSSGFGLRLRG
jgi:hypothetical protein